MVSLCGDAKVTLQKMIAEAGESPPRAEWLEQCRGYVADFWAESDPLRNSDDVPIRPERIGKELGEWLPRDATLVVDTFHAALWTAQMSRMQDGPALHPLRGLVGLGFPRHAGRESGAARHSR